MANSILIKDVILNTKKQDVLIVGNKFSKISDSIDTNATTTIDCKGKMAIIPPFYNGHCHAAMTLLRGYADDMELNTWLNDHIWPAEAKLTAYDVYVGTKLAILEMIKSGTVFFNDMYFFIEESVKACAEMGIRAKLGVTFMSMNPKEVTERRFDYLKNCCDLPSTVSLSVAPHAIYTVDNDLMVRCAKEAERNNQMLHLHLSETQKEVDDCLSQHGTTPVRLLDKLGVLTSNAILAHVVHTDDEEADILADRQSVIVTNPSSNMKLASGAFHFTQHQSRGSRIAIGTDGTSSNNNLDMMQEMKFSALLAKVNEGPKAAPADEVLDIATRKGAKYFGINAGEIKEGMEADALLLDLSNERLVPNFNLTSNIVYSADSSCIDTTICNGQILMQGHKVKGEEQIIAEALDVCRKFAN